MRWNGPNDKDAVHKKIKIKIKIRNRIKTDTETDPMNWLAHLLLSEDDPRARLGNLLADLLKKPQRQPLGEAYQRGFARHRVIDRFTDAHPIFLASKQRLETEHDHFQGIFIDLFYDHF